MITIIVLLILAGVSIAMLTGENGIIAKAREAKEKTEIAAWEERIDLAIIEAEGEKRNPTLEDVIDKLYDNNIIDDKENDVNRETGAIITNEPEYVIEGKLDDYLDNKGEGQPEEPEDEGFFEENSTINGGEGTAMNPTIPEGFKPVDENGAEWGDGTNPPLEEDVSEGLVIEDKQGNQFVWVPVTGNYERNTSYVDIAVSEAAYTDTGYLPEGIQPETDDSTNNENAEKEAVLSKGGFYISRYEAGKEGENTLVSKKGSTVWDHISQEDCKTTAKTFINNENVKSALCSGIQWDMAMAFINVKQDGTGNTYDVTTYSKARHTGSLATSGQNEADRVCNIYDLEGNDLEYVAEKNSYDPNYPFVYRGAAYDITSTAPASNRNYYLGLGVTKFSFRFVLYVM